MTYINPDTTITPTGVFTTLERLVQLDEQEKSQGLNPERVKVLIKELFDSKLISQIALEAVKEAVAVQKERKDKTQQISHLPESPSENWLELMEQYPELNSLFLRKLKKQLAEIFLDQEGFTPQEMVAAFERFFIMLDGKMESPVNARPMLFYALKECQKYFQLRLEWDTNKVKSNQPQSFKRRPEQRSPERSFSFRKLFKGTVYILLGTSYLAANALAIGHGASAANSNRDTHSGRRFQEGKDETDNAHELVLSNEDLSAFLPDETQGFVMPIPPPLPPFGRDHETLASQANTQGDK